jgi:hypothetical protein
MPDKVQREIEELLDKLDNFVPEERFTSKMRDRKRQERAAQSGPSIGERASRMFSRVTVGHMMLAGIALLLVAVFLDGPLGGATRWVFIAAIVLVVASFVLSIRNRGMGSRTPIMKSRPGRTQKMWRGQVIEYGNNEEPRRFDRLKGMFRRKDRP